MYTFDVSLAILPRDAILIEDFLSPQIAIASGNEKYLLFSRLCKHGLVKGNVGIPMFTFFKVFCSII